MGSEISPELVERCVALVRKLVDYEQTPCIEYGLAREARAIVAELPEPVDPDLQEVKRLASLHSVSLTEEGIKAIVAYFRGGRDA